MLVKSQDGIIALNNDNVDMYRVSDKWDGRFKVIARVNDNEFVIGRYSSKEKCAMAISMILDCYTMNLLFMRGQDENPRDLFDDYVADQPLGVFEMPQEDEIYEDRTD
jgi:hypothetical protein